MANVANSELNDLDNGMVDNGNESGSANLLESAHTDDPDTCGICIILSPTSTCCSIEEVAMLRCETCSTYLCSSCNAAHQNMRYLENHQVVMLNGLGSCDQPTSAASTQLCLTHYGEPMNLYCVECEELVCNNCVIGDHRAPTHNCVTLADAETRVKQDLHALVRDGNANIQLLLQASMDVQSRLSELSKQQSSTRDMINGSYEECEAVLKRCWNKALSQLNEFYQELEHNLLKLTHQLNEEVRLVQTACNFTTRLLKRGSSIDSLTLAKVVKKQILNLINNSTKPRAICSGIIECVTDLENFEVAAMSAFRLGISNECALALQNPITNRIKTLTETKFPIFSIPKDIDHEHLHPVSTEQTQSVSTGIVQPMQMLFKFGKLGNSPGQFNSPHGFCLGFEEDIVVADTNNHRIQVFQKNGSFKFQFGNPGPDEGKLWYPRKVAVMTPSGKYVVCDCGDERSRMQIFGKDGHFIKKISIRYIQIVAALTVTKENEIVAVDSVSPNVFVISEDGEMLRWFQCSGFMLEPSDISIHGNYYYLCDFKGHKVVVLNEEGELLSRISYETVTKFPSGIDISAAGDILVCDSHGNHFHVAIFGSEGSLVAEFECPDVKISRCCGLKITSEGYIVTLAKNNNHVLVLNKLLIG